MKRRALLLSSTVGALGVASASGMVLACSLVVSTSGLSDGMAAAPEGGPDLIADAIADVTATVDSPVVESGPDAARDPALVAEYSFEDALGGAAVHDSSGHENNGTMHNGATFAIDGVRGHALAVNGLGFMAATALDGVAFPRSGTLSLWMRQGTTPVSDSSRGVFDNYDIDRPHVFVRHANNAPANEFQMALQAQDNNGQYAAAASFAVQLDVWTHFVVTWNEATSEGAFYVNGTLLARGAYDLPFAPTGQKLVLGEGHVGGIDEVRLYSRALTDAEAAKLD
jgi:hypothetical protein